MQPYSGAFRGSCRVYTQRIDGVQTIGKARVPRGRRQPIGAGQGGSEVCLQFDRALDPAGTQRLEKCQQRRQRYIGIANPQKRRPRRRYRRRGARPKQRWCSLAARRCCRPGSNVDRLIPSAPARLRRSRLQTRSRASLGRRSGKAAAAAAHAAPQVGRDPGSTACASYHWLFSSQRKQRSTASSRATVRARPSSCTARRTHGT